MKKINLLYLCLLVYCQNTTAQNTFSKKIQLPFVASVFSSVVALDSFYYSIGVALDTINGKEIVQLPLFVKTDAQGNIKIKKIYKDSSSYVLFTPTLQLIDNNKLLVSSGFIRDTSRKSTVVLKWDLNGNVVEKRRYSGPVEDCLPTNVFTLTSKDGLFTYLIDWAINLPCVKDNYNYEYLVTKLDKSGNKIWQKYYGDELRDIAYCATEDSDGGLIVGGEKRNDLTIGKHYTWRNYIIKIDKDGNLLWEYLAPIEKKWYHTTDIRAMIKTKDNGLVVAAHRAEEDDSVFPSELLFEYMIYKLDSNRNIIWRTFMKPVYYAAFTQMATMRALSDESGFVGCGKVWYPIKNHGYGGAIFKVAPNGDSLWLRRYEAVTDTSIIIDENLADIKETKDKGFILCGESYKFGVKNPEQSPWLLKLDSCGCLVPGCGKKAATKDFSTEPKLQIYPNPVSDVLGVYLENLPNRQPELLLLYDEQGHLVKKHNLQHEDTTYLLDMTAFPSGTYILKVGNATRKVVKM